MPHDREKATSLDALNEAFMELDHAYDKLAKSCGLSEPEYWSLVLIRHGVETQREISQQLSLSRQTLNSAFKLLIRKGLIRLEPSKRDQRSKRAIVTQEGHRFVEENILRVGRLEEEAWKTLTEEERTMLVRLTRQFSAALLRSLRAHPTTHLSSSEDL